MKESKKVTKLVKDFRNVNIAYSEQLKTLNLPTLKWRREYLDMLMLFKIVHGNVTYRKQLMTFCSEICNISSRRHKLNMYKVNLHTNVLKFHFINRVINVWNALPHNLLNEPSFSIFKAKLKLYLMSADSPVSSFDWAY